MSGSPARAVLVYNLGRLGLFVGCVLLGWIAGLRSIWLLVAALVVSGVLSYFLLARQRIAMGAAMGDAISRGRARATRRTEEEDAYVDQLLASQDHVAVAADGTDGITRPDR